MLVVARRRPRLQVPATTSTPVVAPVLALALALIVTGCTEDDPPPPSPSPTPSATATPTPQPQAAPLDVTIADAAGRLPRAARKIAAARVESTVGGYLEGAFLGDFPRTRYADAWTHFTPAATRLARRDLGVLTHADRGARIASVVPVRQEVRVRALAPRRKMIGGTARVRLVLRVTDVDGAVQRVRIAGRLLLTRAPDRTFRIFGYDLERSSGPLRAPAAPGGDA